jgi:hypothetical protein
MLQGYLSLGVIIVVLISGRRNADCTVPASKYKLQCRKIRAFEGMISGLKENWDRNGRK